MYLYVATVVLFGLCQVLLYQCGSLVFVLGCSVVCFFFFFGYCACNGVWFVFFEGVFWCEGGVCYFVMCVLLFCEGCLLGVGCGVVLWVGGVWWGGDIG